MKDSKKIAGLVGPVFIVTAMSELPFVQPHLYDTQIPPVVYLSGLLFFVAGLAIVRVHNHWDRNWTVLVTWSGWFMLVLGFVRMFAASSYQKTAANTNEATLALFELVIMVIGIFMTWKAYKKGDSHTCF